MFEGIPLYEIRYVPGGNENSLAGIRLSDAELEAEARTDTARFFLKDCHFVMDGSSLVSRFFPVSPFAREHFLYVQSFSYWKAGPAHFTRRTGLDSYLLCCTYSGQGELEYRGRTYALEAGTAFWIDCRELHQYKSAGPSWEHCVLHFDGVPAAPLFADFTRENGCVFPLRANADFQAHLTKLLKAWTAVSPYREYQASSLLTDLLLAIVMASDSYKRMQANMPPQLEDIILFLNTRYYETISLEDLSARFAISKYHLCRVFKQYMGCTVNEYVTRLRLEQAKELLRTTTLTASQIGAIVGVEDENYFYRLFRTHVGMPPHRYRKQ